MITAHSMSSGEARALGSLAISCVRASGASLGTRALSWYNALLCFGLNVPLVVVHDLGAALLGAGEAYRSSDNPPPFPGAKTTTDEVRSLLDGYGTLLEEVSQTSAAAQIQKSSVDDSVLVALIAHALNPVASDWHSSTRFEPIPVYADTFEQAQGLLRQLWTSTGREAELGFLQHLAQQRLHLIIGVEQVDPDVLEFLSVVGQGGSMSKAELSELITVFDSPDVSDVVKFTSDILPSSPEAGPDLRAPSEQSYQILVDASASMRGGRAVFARGFAIALARRMSLLGADTSVRFFDSRLYDPMRLRQGRPELQEVGRFHVAGVLAFKGEQGRNYTRVFSQLAGELERSKGQVRNAVCIITHAECQIPAELVRRMRESAELCGVFLLSSGGELDLEYVPALTLHEVVTGAALRDATERAARARSIIERASSAARRDLDSASGTMARAGL